MAGRNCDVFVGREKELASLNKLYDEKSFQMVVMYGRRRIGKTTLISAFVAKRPAIFFTAQEVNDTLNLLQFSKKIYAFFDVPQSTGAFLTWNDAFDFLGDRAKERQFILAFDEFPYAAAANRSLKSVLQTAIDHKLKGTAMFLILCGSRVGFMENEVLGYKSPLFGRRTSQMKIEGFDYYDAGKMLTAFDSGDRLRFYACVGGTPHYLSQIKGAETFKENIKRLFFDISGYLYNEPMMLLQQELREPAMYNSIIAAIAGGASRLNEIATRINEDASKVGKYLQTLMNLQIIQKLYPFDEDMQSSRKGIYRLADNGYGFWYRFVFPRRPEIESGNGDIVADNEVFGGNLSTYIGKPPFETVCLQYLKRANRNGQLPFTATSFGSWWGADPKERIQADFDAVAANRATGQIILGECKWKTAVNATAEIQKLKAKEHLLGKYGDRYYYIFSKAPFAKGDMPLKSKRFALVSVDMLFE
jgi:AAA+ ATPase superfamily predicted ATPase